MSEIMNKNYDVINQKENPAEELKNISNLENLFKNFDKKETIECCKNLNNIFAEEIAKLGFDFKKAMQSKVPNPIGIEA